MSSESRVITLSEVSKSVDYGYTASATTIDTGFKFLRITDIQNGFVEWQSVPFCKIDQALAPKYRLESGDIVVARTGNSTGENYLYDSEEKSIFASYLIRFRIDKSIAEPGYVWRCMRSPSWWDFVNGAKTGSAQAGANAKVLGSFKFELRSLPEQKTIAHILGTLDDKIELNRKTNETLEAIAKALFKSWFVDFDPVRAKAEGRLTGLPAEISDLFPDSFEKSELGEIPRGWRVQAFGSLLSISRDSINPSDTPLELFDHYSIPAYDSGCKPSKEFGESIKSQKFLVEDDSLLVSKLNPSTPRVWIPYSSGTRRRICSTEFLVCRTFQGVGRSFAYCLASSDPIIETMIGLAGGTSNSHQRIRPEDFLNLTCCPGNEQVRTVFCSLVDPIMNSVLWNKQESVDLGQMRDTLLPKLISGELRIPDAEALVAEAGI